MARKVREKKEQAKNSGANLGFEAKLWAAANALRCSMDAAEYLPASHPARQAGGEAFEALAFPD